MSRIAGPRIPWPWSDPRRRAGDLLPPRRRGGYLAARRSAIAAPGRSARGTSSQRPVWLPCRPRFRRCPDARSVGIRRGRRAPPGSALAAARTISAAGTRIAPAARHRTSRKNCVMRFPLSSTRCRTPTPSPPSSESRRHGATGSARPRKLRMTTGLSSHPSSSAFPPAFPTASHDPRAARAGAQARERHPPRSGAGVRRRTRPRPRGPDIRSVRMAHRSWREDRRRPEGSQDQLIWSPSS